MPRKPIVLNVAPIAFEDSECEVAYQPYESKEQLQRLRQEHQETHAFRRERDSIVSISYRDDLAPVGNTRDSIRLHEHLPLSAVLARNAILTHLIDIGRPVFTHHPIRFLAVGERQNLLEESAPFGYETPPWLAVRPLFFAEVRVFQFDNIEPFLGVALDIRTRRIITASCADLLNMGVNLSHSRVGRLIDSNDARLQPRFEIVGTVRCVNGATLELSNTRGDISSIAANEVTPEASWDVFKQCLSVAYKEKASDADASLECLLAERRSGPKKLELTNRVQSYFSKRNFELRENVPFAISGLLDSSKSPFPSLESAPRPVYVFDPTGARTDVDRINGGKQHGPYSQQTFAKNRPRICVVCQAKKKGLVDKFVNKFLNGIQVSGSAFRDGLLGRYRLETPSVAYYPADDDSATAYRQQAERAINDAEDDNNRWDLAFVQVDEDFRQRHGERNPYLVTKRLFMTQQVPVQAFRSSTAALNEKRLSYALNNIGLQVYSKLNGIPWLLKSDSTVAHELVVGMGSASIAMEQSTDQIKVVGITTVLSGDGNYWLSNLTKSVPLTDYAATLLDSLRRTISRVRDDMNWQPGDHVRLVFHAFKPLKEAEIEAVKGLMKELGSFDTEFAFLHLAESHPYLLFDCGQEGVPTFGNYDALRGKYAPSRGRFLLLSDYESLLVLTGPNELKRVDDGIPAPVLLKLHRSSTFKDMTYLSRQTFAFASHSWRTFSHPSMPVTIYYSDLVAQLLGKLSTVPQWDPNVMLGRIGRTRWFL